MFVAHSGSSVHSTDKQCSSNTHVPTQTLPPFIVGMVGNQASAGTDESSGQKMEQEK